MGLDDSSNNMEVGLFSEHLAALPLRTALPAEGARSLPGEEPGSSVEPDV